MRGDNELEAQRRLQADLEDFKDMESHVNKIIYNNYGTDLDSVVCKIIDYIEENN